MATDQLIVSLFVEPGKDGKDPIGVYNRSIVFFPRNTPTDQEVRVILKEIPGKQDRRGKPMYRASPAPPVLSERWRSNADGSLTCLQVSTDWLGSETESAGETRLPAERLGTPVPRTDKEVVWGGSLAESRIVITQVRVTPLERETIQNCCLVWRQFSSVEEEQSVVHTDITSVVCGYSNAAPVGFEQEEISWAGKTAKLLVGYTYDGYATNMSHEQVWDNLPADLQRKFNDNCPVCACGRHRILPSALRKDAFGRCAQCRRETACERCGAKGDSLLLLSSGRLACATCKPLEEEELLVNRVLSIDRRKELAQQAKHLHAGQAFPHEAGELILGAQLDHLSDYDRNRVMGSWRGYPYYYLTDEGWYGSKFVPASLQVLSLLGQASGDGLLEMARWLSSGVHRLDYGDITDRDYFWQTQVCQKKIPHPQLTERGLDQSVLAIKLRGPEGLRCQIRDALARIREERFGGEHSPHLDMIRSAMEDKAQDYSVAAEHLRVLEAELAQEERGEVLLGFEACSDGWVIRPDGTYREPDRREYGRGNTVTKRWTRVEANELALQRFFSAAEPKNKVVKMPVGELTPGQKARVRELEADLNCLGGFGINTKPNPQQQVKFTFSKRRTKWQYTCEYGCFGQLSNHEAKLYENNEPVTLSCSHCSRQEVLATGSKVSSPDTSDKKNSTLSTESTGESMADMLARLKGKWS